MNKNSFKIKSLTNLFKRFYGVIAIKKIFPSIKNLKSNGT
nr:MAG TPA: hypothetical protein [Caudoviricetes sp.]